MINLKKNAITGSKICEKAKIKIIKIIKPKRSREISMFRQLAGKIAKRIFEPSKGGMGTRLKIPKIRFIKTISVARSKNGAGKNANDALLRIINPKIIAITKLETGPAAARRAGPHFWFLKLYGLNGTGFAQPKIKPPRR